MPVKDADIRRALHKQFLQPFHDDPATVVVGELGICRGDARVDVAVINCVLHGYEIKSERDTLDRLPRQVEYYGRVLDRMTLVVSASHVNGAEAIIPGWWGVVEVHGNASALTLRTRRETARNPSTDPVSVALLLWREELLDALKRHGLDSGYRSKTRKIMAERLADGLAVGELCHEVREAIKRRSDWRAEPVPAQSAAPSLLLPMW